MLVRFTVKNVLSFKEETVLDLSAVNAYQEHPENMILQTDEVYPPKERFLKAAAIYGANASGKSNLHMAMKYFQRIVSESLNTVDEGEMSALQKYYIPFSFDEEQENSEFELIFILGLYEYTYGYVYNDNRIVTEWLYRRNRKTRRNVTVFEREEDRIVFGACVRKTCERFREQIPVETLALTFFNRLNLDTELFKDVYAGTMDTLVVPADFCEDTRVLEAFLPQLIDEEKEDLLHFLSAIDTGIIDIAYDDSEKEPHFLTYHIGQNGIRYPLNLYYESEGTLKCMMLFLYVRIAILSGKSIFVDELNIKLHPLLLKFVIDLFYESESEAQLIYTTHDTTLLDKKFFRRDQIWFVQKDEYGCSQLYALSDFKVRSDASFEKDYLAGVYGGIPMLQEFEMKEGK